MTKQRILSTLLLVALALSPVTVSAMPLRGPSVPIAPLSTIYTWDNDFHWNGNPDMTWYLVAVYDSEDTLIVDQWLLIGTNIDCGEEWDCHYSPAATEDLEYGTYHWRIIDYDGEYHFNDYVYFTYTLPPTATPITDVTIDSTVSYGDYGVIIVVSALCLLIILVALIALGLYVGQRKGRK